MAPSTGAAGGGTPAKSVEAAWLTALRRLASDTGDALELHTNMCSSLLELELEPPSSFFLVLPNADDKVIQHKTNFSDISPLIKISLFFSK